MANYVLGSLLVLLGFFLIWCGRLTDEKFILKTQVAECFKGVDWSKQRFYNDSIVMKDGKGNEFFYPITVIDPAIKKLNDKL